MENYSFVHYMQAQAETRAARHQHDYAGAALELAQIRERLAEIASQHEPLAALLAAPMGERDRLYAAAFYVVVGRPYVPDADRARSEVGSDLGR